MACAAAKLGAKTVFIGQAGDDNFGRALQQILVDNGVNAEHLLRSKDYPTTLAFVHLDERGDRSFSFYRHGGADTMIDFQKIDCTLLEQCRYFFCSSVLMAEGASRESSFLMIEAARRAGVPVVFDPNLRFNLWRSPEELKEQVLRALPLVDILKVSEEEALFLTGETDLDRAIDFLRKNYSFQALLVTLGAMGCRAYAGELAVIHEAYPIPAVDTTAAGDSFTGGFLASLLKSGKSVGELTQAEFTEILRTANIVGGLTASRKGAIHALPSAEEVASAQREWHPLA